VSELVRLLLSFWLIAAATYVAAGVALGLLESRQGRGARVADEELLASPRDRRG
jgi:hypothetical protein